MAEAPHKEMTVEEFLVWCLDQDERYELVDGYPVTLRGKAGASTAHDQLGRFMRPAPEASIESTRPATSR